MKLYSQIEQIFRYRLLSNKDIPIYLKRMTNMGKVDDVKKAELFALILNRLGEIEDEALILREVPQTIEIASDFTRLEYKGENVIAGNGSDGDLNIKEDGTEDITFPCPDCDMVAKSALGLQSHSRKHKKQV